MERQKLGIERKFEKAQLKGGIIGAVLGAMPFGSILLTAALYFPDKFSPIESIAFREYAALGSLTIFYTLVSEAFGEAYGFCKELKKYKLPGERTKLSDKERQFINGCFRDVGEEGIKKD